MFPPEEPIVRRDFPRSADGYDRAAVDAHLETVAAGWRTDRRADVPPAEQVVAAGRLLLGQISALRVELKNLSASLREQGVTIGDALEELLALEDALAPPPAAPSPPASRPAAPPVSGSPPPPAAGSPPASGPAAGTPAAPPLPGPAAAGTVLRTPLATESAPDLAPPTAGPPPAAPDPRTLADARLVALDMALGGSSRAEIDRELARFDLPDRAGLLDEVLSAIG
jgi:hypothetical protein